MPDRRSATTLDRCVGELVRMTGVSLSQALTMVTLSPSRFANRSVRLSLGSRADLVRFRWRNELLIEEVWLAGQPVDNRSHAHRLC